MAAARGKKNQAIVATEQQATLEAVKALDTERVVGEINNLQVSVQGTLAGLSATITNKIQQLSTVDEAIKLKNERLKTLHAIEAEAVQLDDLKAQREEELANWEKDRDARNDEWSKEELERDTTQKRSFDEWSYKFEQDKKKTLDQHAAFVADSKRQESIRQQELQKQWADREATIKAKEIEIVELKKQVEGFETKLKAEVAKAEAILSNSMERTHKHEKALLQKDAESAQSVCEMRTESLEKALEQQQNHISELKAQLTAARQDANNIATQALTSASGREVANALRQVVDTRDQGASGKQGK